MIKAREIEAKMLLVNTEDKFLQRCFGMHISPHGGTRGERGMGGGRRDQAATQSLWLLQIAKPAAHGILICCLSTGSLVAQAGVELTKCRRLTSSA